MSDKVKPVVVRCCRSISSGDPWHRSQCSRAMKVMRNGKPYCAQHDPEKVAAKDTARNARWEAEWAAQKQARKSAQALADALGAGSPDGDTGGIVLTAEEAQRLIAQIVWKKP